jgi:hypothetical protein
MVDAADRRRVSGASMDRLSLSYVFTTGLASFLMGARNQLGYSWARLVLAHGNLQILPMAIGIAGTVDDTLGTPIAKALNRLPNNRQLVGFLHPLNRQILANGFNNALDTSHCANLSIPAGILDRTSRSPTERNAADMPGSAAAVEAS